MAKVEKPVLPLRLYRYRSLKRTRQAVAQEVSSLKEGYLWCSDFSGMNDPMEGFYRPSSSLERLKDFETIADELSRGKQDIGIACFSDTKENELMWTHYSDNYSAICIAYSTRRLLKSLPAEVSLIRLGYGDEPPRVSPTEVNNGTAARRILSQKKYNWSYEREWRLLGPKGRVDIERNCVASIYFGSRISDDYKSRIVQAVEDLDVSVYIMNVEGYEHSWERLALP